MFKYKITVGLVLTLAMIGFAGSYTLCGACSNGKESLPKKVEKPIQTKMLQVKGAPVAVSKFTKENPANSSPYLQWTKYGGAVVYELEVYAKEKLILSDAYIYINGYNLK